MSSIIGRAIIVTPSPINADKILNNNTWEVVKQVSDRKQGQNFWSVGDCKEVTMNGKVSDGLPLQTILLGCISQDLITMQSERVTAQRSKALRQQIMAHLYAQWTAVITAANQAEHGLI